MAGRLVAALAFTHWMPSSSLPSASPFHLWQSEMSLDIAQCPGGTMLPWLRTTGMTM